MGKNLKIYNLEFHFVLLGVDFVNCGYNFGVLGDPESSNESIRKKGGEGKTYSFVYLVMNIRKICLVLISLIALNQI